MTHPGSISVLIENRHEAGFFAVALGLPDCEGYGTTRQEALTSLSQQLSNRLQNAEIVFLDITSPNLDNPWIKFAGMFEHDPYFDEVIANMEADRLENTVLESDNQQHKADGSAV